MLLKPVTRITTAAAFATVHNIPCFIVKSANILFQHWSQEERATNSRRNDSSSLFPWPTQFGQGIPNFRGARIPVSSHFNLPAWESYLTTYDDNIVVDFLKFGWPINCDTSVLPKSTLNNHGSATGATGEHTLNTYISKELPCHSVWRALSMQPFQYGLCDLTIAVRP